MSNLPAWAVVPLAAAELAPGAGPPLVILHGHLGSSRNWRGAGPRLAAATGRRAVALDLRNHGQSPWAAPWDYPTLAGDVRAWLDAAGLGRAVLVGHSMGGKTALRLALDAPERVAALVVVDIAPRAYEGVFDVELAALRDLDLGALQSRREADEALAAAVPDWALRQFLLTNLGRGPDGGLAWSIPLPFLAAHRAAVAAAVAAPGEAFAGPALFVRGGRSDFVTDADLPAIRAVCPAAEVVTLPGAGHNLHHDQPEAFAAAVAAWLGRVCRD